ncbi:MAG: hypothetical protein HYR91_08670 [Flavobacteriia bacterium]|nr:hypothetical protein [Flavobacteriia bacterium]
MKIDSIYLQTETKFAKQISNWIMDSNIEICEFKKHDNQENEIDGLIIFTENQSIDKDCGELRDIFDRKQKPVQKIDINGTLNVGVSNFTFWLERNNCKKILAIGADSLTTNPNFERLLSHLKA